MNFNEQYLVFDMEYARRIFEHKIEFKIPFNAYFIFCCRFSGQNMH